MIVSTPQVIANDLRKGRIDLRDVKLVIFDEAHRAVGRYAYVGIANALKVGRQQGDGHHRLSRWDQGQDQGGLR